MNHQPDKTKYYVLYDGACGFCKHWVQWILARDTKDRFLFASLQSEFGQNFLRDRGLNRTNFNTLYLWKPESYYLVKSQAVTEIASILGGRYKILAHLNVLPKILGDQIYDQVAARRQRLNPPTCKTLSDNDRRKIIS